MSVRMDKQMSAPTLDSGAFAVSSAKHRAIVDAASPEEAAIAFVKRGDVAILGHVMRVAPYCPEGVGLWFSTEAVCRNAGLWTDQ